MLLKSLIYPIIINQPTNLNESNNHLQGWDKNNKSGVAGSLDDPCSHV